MSHKSKGIRGEREVINLFWSEGWAAIRSAGSGSMHFPSPDILAGNKLRALAIECKVTKDTRKYFEKKEVRDLKSFSEYFGAEPWIAVKFRREDWCFINTEDLDETDKCYCITEEKAKRKGLKFKEVIGKF